MHSMIRTLGRLAAVGLVALLLAGFAAEDAAAETKKRDDFGSKELFKLECELLGGTFSEDAYGNTNCHHPSGTWVQCDANGKDCWITTPFRPQEPAGPRVPDNQVATPDGGTSGDTVKDPRVVSPARQVETTAYQP